MDSDKDDKGNEERAISKNTSVTAMDLMAYGFLEIEDSNTTGNDVH